MDIARRVTHPAAHTGNKGVFIGRIEVDLVNDLSRVFRSHIGNTCDDSQTFRIIGKGIGRHKWVAGAVRAFVVGGTLPTVTLTVFAQGVTGAGFDTLFAIVTKVRSDRFIGRQFRIGDDKSPPLIGAEIIGQYGTGQTDFTQTAVAGALFKIESYFSFFVEENFVVSTESQRVRHD